MTIAEKFDQFTSGLPADTPDNVRESLRVTFFAGASSLFHSVVNCQSAEEVEAIYQELKESANRHNERKAEMMQEQIQSMVENIFGKDAVDVHVVHLDIGEKP